MGRDKALLPHWRGGTFLDYAIAQVGELTAQVIVAGRDLPDEVPGLGPVGGLVTALRFAAINGYSAILVTPLDMPRLAADDLRRMVVAASEEMPTCASFDGVAIEPLVAIYPVALLSELEAVANSPRRSVSGWLQFREVHKVLLPATANANVNLPADLVQRAELKPR